MQKNAICQLFKYFVISLLFMLLGFTIGVLFIPESIVAIANVIMIVFLIGLLIFTLIMKFKHKHTTGKISFPMEYVYTYTFIEGVLLYPTLVYYLESLGVALFFNIVLGTIAIFGLLSYIAAKQPAGRFVGLGKILLTSLFVMLVMIIVNAFLQVPFINTLLSIAGVIIFSAYTLYDVNRFKTDLESGFIQTKNDYSIYCLDLFLDFINLLLDILDLFDN